jgi:hypothetical protein
MEKSLQELMEEARAKAIEVGWVADPEPDDTPVVAPVEDPVDEFAGTDFANEQMVLPPPPESDLPEALRRRDAGMAQASSADRVQAWKAAAGAWLGGRSRDSEFTADDLVAAIGLPDPSDRGKNNVVGAWINAMARAGKIVSTEKRRKSARPQGHANPQLVWRVM